MEIINNKAIRLRVKDPQRITALIPKSKVLDDGHTVLVHWGDDEVKVLTNLGFKNVPSLIERDYDWPGVYKPFAHQKTTAGFLTLHSRAYCFNNMGTGKTASTAWAIDYLMNKGIIRRALILCPLSIMQSAWVNDCFKTIMHRSVGVAHGTAATRRSVVNGASEIVIINFDGTHCVQRELMNGGFDLIVVDEATAYKKASTKRWKALASMIKPNTWLWLMTGTPAAQSPVDAYGLVKLMHPSRVSATEAAFKDRVMYKVAMYRWLPKPDANQYIYDLMQPAIRFSKEECLDLPERLYQTVHVPLTQQQQVYYDKLKKEMLFELSDEAVTAMNAAVLLNKLLQIGAGGVYTDNGLVVEFDVSNRYEETINLIEGSTHSVLIFCTFKSSIITLHERLTRDGYIADYINGDVSLNRRSEIINRFQTSGKKQVLIIQPQSAAHGITLTAANTVIWWSPTTSYEHYAQANDRVHRAGQRNPCLVVHLEGSEVERQLYKALEMRKDSQIDLLSLYRAVVRA